MRIIYKTVLKTGGVLLFSGLALTLAFLFIGGPRVQAQGPDFEEYLSSLSSRQDPFDLTILKRSSQSTVTSGDRITYTITITNNGPNSALGHQFQDHPPAQMQNIAYQFSTAAISDSQNPPSWLFTDPLAKNQTIHITVTGILTSASSVTVTNVATVSAFNKSAELTPTNNTSTAQVWINSTITKTGTTLYLPLIEKSPPIVLAYQENFDSGTPWFTFNANGCNTTIQNGQYWIDLDPSNLTCFPPAENENKPELPYRTYGEFQVDAYHSEGASEAWMGLFINGTGGNNYYLFKIKPNTTTSGCTNGGDWVLIRNRNGTQSTVASGSCHPAIKRGYGIANTNVLKITHTDDRKVSVFANGTLLNIFTDDTTNHLTGQATGLYAESAGVNIIIKYDNFTVFK